MIARCVDLINKIRTIVQAIKLKSHVSAAALGQSTPSTDEDIGGKRPPGGIQRADDWSLESQGFGLKSADYFQEKLDRMIRQRRVTVEALQALHAEATEALKAWEKSPLPHTQDPEYGSPQWKRYLAETDEDAGDLARRFNVTRRYINQVRADWREAA